MSSLHNTRKDIKKNEIIMHNANVKERIKKLREKKRRSVLLVQKQANKLKEAQLRYEQARESGDKDVLEKAKKEFEESKAKFQKAKEEAVEVDEAIKNMSKKLITTLIDRKDSQGDSPIDSSNDSSEEDEDFLATLLAAERNYGATLMQRAYRSYSLRKFISEQIIYRKAAIIQKFWRVAKHNWTFKRHLFLNVRLRILEHGIAEKERKEKEDLEWREIWDNVAIKLQRIYRYYRDYKKAQKENDMIRARLALEGRELKRIRQRALEQAERFRIQRAKEVAAAIKIQSWWRVQLAKKLMLKKLWERELYAILLQSSWRRKVA
jgi:hypothetical protein